MLRIATCLPLFIVLRTFGLYSALRNLVTASSREMLFFRLKVATMLLVITPIAPNRLNLVFRHEVRSGAIFSSTRNRGLARFILLIEGIHCVYRVDLNCAELTGTPNPRNAPVHNPTGALEGRSSLRIGSKGSIPLAPFLFHRFGNKQKKHLIPPRGGNDIHDRCSGSRDPRTGTSLHSTV